MRERIFSVIEVAEENDRLSRIYDVIMMAVILLSLLPIAMKSTGQAATRLDHFTTIVFVIDYLLRLATADFKLKKGVSSFVLYPFTYMAIIDLLSILPSIMAVNSAFRILKVFRLLRTLRVFRVLKVVRYSKSISIIINVFKSQKEPLYVVGGLAIGYILVSALIVISIEPNTFPTFFDAVYWATVSLTTVGYGDIYATSTAGKIITMISSVFGIAIVALPAGIITAGYMDEVENNRRNNQDTPKNQPGEDSTFVSVRECNGDQEDLLKVFRAFEKAKDEGSNVKAIETAMNMIKRGKCSLEEIADDTGLSIDKIKELAEILKVD